MTFRVLAGALATAILALAAATACTVSASSIGLGKCGAPAYHQFDFWAGHYVARDKRGTVEGRTNVDWILGGCVLEEHFTSATDTQNGVSFSFYDARVNRYVHFWVDSWGNTIELHGRRDGKSMLMTGLRRDKKGRMLLERTRWTPLSAMTVSQVWDYSSNRGRTWANRIDWVLTKVDV